MGMQGVVYGGTYLAWHMVSRHGRRGTLPYTSCVMGVGWTRLEGMMVTSTLEVERARCQSSDPLTEYRTKTAFGVSHYAWRVEGTRRGRTGQPTRLHRVLIAHGAGKCSQRENGARAEER